MCGQTTMKLFMDITSFFLFCTNTVYILSLDGGLHLLHAPLWPKISTFYGLLLLSMET